MTHFCVFCAQKCFMPISMKKLGKKVGMKKNEKPLAPCMSNYFNGIYIINFFWIYINTRNRLDLQNKVTCTDIFNLNIKIIN